MTNDPRIKIVNDTMFVRYKYVDAWCEVPKIPDHAKQIFSHRDVDGVFRYFDISKIDEMVREHPERYEIREFHVTPEQTALAVENHGVEQDHVNERITPEFVERPGYMMEFPDTTQIVLDGNHRYVWLALHGKPTMKFFVFTEEQLKPVMLDIPDELGEKLL